VGVTGIFHVHFFGDIIVTTSSTPTVPTRVGSLSTRDQLVKNLRQRKFSVEHPVIYDLLMRIVELARVDDILQELPLVKGLSEGKHLDEIIKEYISGPRLQIMIEKGGVAIQSQDRGWISIPFEEFEDVELVLLARLAQKSCDDKANLQLASIPRGLKGKKATTEQARREKDKSSFIQRTMNKLPHLWGLVSGS